MKYYSAFLLSILPMLALSAQAANDCNAKKSAIEQQIAHAKAHGNSHQVSGLQRALQQTTANCRDDVLRAEQQRKIADKERKLFQRQRELKQTEQSENKNKVLHKKKKVEQAQRQLQEAKDKAD